MKTTIIIILLLLAPNVSFAGGDYWENIITGIQETQEKTTIRLESKNKENDLFGNCTEVTIESKFEHVPWFSWLIPFVENDHPTPKEHQQAIEFLKQHYKNNKAIYFGYMGYGLVPSDKACTYKSKGFKIEKTDHGEVVVSYHDET